MVCAKGELSVGDGSRRGGGRDAALTLCRHASLQMVRSR